MSKIIKVTSPTGDPLPVHSLQEPESGGSLNLQQVTPVKGQIQNQTQLQSHQDIRAPDPVNPIGFLFHFDQSVFHSPSRFHVKKMLGLQQQSKADIKLYLGMVLGREHTAIQTVRALQVLGHLSPEAARVHLRQAQTLIVQGIAQQLPGYARDQKKQKMIYKYLDRAFQNLPAINQSQAKSCLDFMAGQYSRSSNLIPESIQPLFLKSILQPIMNDLVVQLYGGKCAGLVQLNQATKDSEVSVPPFIGLSHQDIRYMLLTGKLDYRLEAFVKQISEKSNVKLMVRSSALNEDQEGQSNAGCYETCANVDPVKEAIIAAVQRVNDSFSSQTAKAQSALYDSPDQSLDPVSSETEGAIVIQLMVGEEPGVPDSIPVSGVGLYPDPMSQGEDTFRVTSAFGHGEGIVQGIVPADETIGIFDPETKTIHAKTRIEAKTDRMAPVTGQGLKLHKNSPDSMNAKALSNTGLNQYTSLLQQLSKTHATGADLEFVQSQNQAYAVQQRSQDSLHTTTPRYVSDLFVQGHSSEAIEVISNKKQPQNFHSRKVLFNTSLADAFQAFLQLPATAHESSTTLAQDQIKAVVVTGKGLANSHAALMFRKAQISIYVMPSRQLLNAVQKSSSFAVCEQRGLLFQNRQLQPMDMLAGQIRYPAVEAFSLESEEIQFTAADLKELEQLRPLLESRDQQTDSFLRQLKQLESLIVKVDSTSSSQVHAAIAKCLVMASKVMALAQMQQQSELFAISKSLCLDLTRLSSAVRLGRNQSQKLLYLNWIRAAVFQMPEEHGTTQNVVSLSSEFRKSREHQQFQQWYKAVELHLQMERSVKGLKPLAVRTPEEKSEFEMLYRLKSTITQPKLAELWLRSLSAMVRDPDMDSKSLQLLTDLSLQTYKQGLWQALLADLYRPSGAVLSSNELLSGLQQNSHNVDLLQQLQQTLNQMQEHWASPEGFESRLQQLQQMNELLPVLIPHFTSKKPAMTAQLLSQAGHVYEQIDLALKTIVTSDRYTSEEQRVHDFKRLLKLMYTSSLPLIERVYGHSVERARLNHYREQFDWIDHPELNTFYLNYFTPDGDSNLMPSSTFMVASALLDNPVTDTLAARLKSFGDYHTFVHQNIRQTLGKMALKCRVDQILTQDQRGLLKELLIEIDAHDSNADTIKTRLSGIETAPDGFRLILNVTLRQHGLRIYVEPGPDSTSFAISMEGENEHERFNIIMNQIAQSKAEPYFQDLQLGADALGEAGTASQYSMSWTLPGATPLAEMKAQYQRILQQIVQDSFLYATTRFRDYDGFINRVVRLNRLVPQFVQLETAIEHLPEAERLEKVTDFFYGYMNADSMKAISREKIPVTLNMPRETVSRLIREYGYLQGRLGLFELDKALHFSILFNRGRYIPFQDIQTHYDKTQNMRRLLFNISNFSSPDRIYGQDALARIIGPELAQLLDRSADEFRELIEFLAKTSWRADPDSLAAIFHALKNASQIQRQNVIDVLDHCTGPSFHTAVQDLPKLLGYTDEISLEDRLEFLQGYVDMSDMGWNSLPGFTGKLYAGSAPFNSEEAQAAFYQELSAKNISQIVDLRYLDPKAKYHDPQYYPTQYKSATTKGAVQMEKVNPLEYDVRFERKSGFKTMDVMLASQDTEAKPLRVSAYLQWADLSVIPPQHLQALGRRILKAGQNGENVYIHCEAGIGRTGTLVTWVQVQAQLQQRSQPETEEVIVQMVQQQILKNRDRRQAGAVETPAQFNLILQALGVDNQALAEQYSASLFQQTA